MPRGNNHMLFNAFIGLLSGMALYDDFLNILLFSVLCILTASLPDYIEKPRSKYHRKFFHSWTAFTASLIIFTPFSFTPFSGLIYGYSCHILLDKARTKSFSKFMRKRSWSIKT